MNTLGDWEYESEKWCAAYQTTASVKLLCGVGAYPSALGASLTS
jgi:hypothetical protein